MRHWPVPSTQLVARRHKRVAEETSNNHLQIQRQYQVICHASARGPHQHFCSFEVVVPAGLAEVVDIFKWTASIAQESMALDFHSPAIAAPPGLRGPVHERPKHDTTASCEYQSLTDVAASLPSNSATQRHQCEYATTAWFPFETFRALQVRADVAIFQSIAQPGRDSVLRAASHGLKSNRWFHHWALGCWTVPGR